MGRFQDGRLSETGSREDFKPVKLKANGLPNNNKNHNRKAFVLTKATNEYNVLKPPGSSGKSPSNLDVPSLVRQAVKCGREVASKKERNSVDDNFQETRANDADKVLEMAVLRNGKNREPNHDTGTGSEVSPKDHAKGGSAAAYGQRLGLAIPRSRVRAPLWALAGFVSR